MSARRQSELLTRPMIEGRYSYDDPPAPGDTVISPAGRCYLVINVVADSKDCICQRVNGANTARFQANDLRYYYRSVK